MFFDVLFMLQALQPSLTLQPNLQPNPQPNLQPNPQPNPQPKPEPEPRTSPPAPSTHPAPPAPLQHFVFFRASRFVGPATLLHAPLMCGGAPEASASAPSLSPEKERPRIPGLMEPE